MSFMMMRSVLRRGLPTLFQLRYQALSQSRAISVDSIQQRSLGREVRDRSVTAESLLPRQHDRLDLAPMISQVSEKARQRDADGAFEILAQVEQPNLALQNAVLNACAKSHVFQRAWDLWTTMPQKDLVSYNTMIGICGSDQQFQRAEEIWAAMSQDGLQPNLLTYTAMIKTCGQCRRAEEALNYFTSLKTVATPDGVAFAAAMSVVARIGDYARTREIFVEMMEAGIAPTHHHINSLLTSCAKECDSTTAEAIFKLMPAYQLKPREVDYTILLACCRRDVHRCREILQEMRDANTPPGALTFQQIVQAEVDAGNSEQAGLLIKEAQAQNVRLTTKLKQYAEKLGL